MLRQLPRATISDTGYLLRLLACLGALLALRLAAVYFAKTDLVLDEAQYWTWSQELAFGYFSKPPMIAWVIRGISEVCGNSEACVRSASPLLYTLTSIIIFFTARVLYDARIGFWSGVDLRHAAGRLLFVAADHDRCSADPVLVDHALRLGDAGAAAEPWLSRSCSASPSASACSPSRRCSMSSSASACMRPSARRRGTRYSGGRGIVAARDRPCLVRAERRLERRARLPHRQAHRNQYRLASIPTSIRCGWSNT